MAHLVTYAIRLMERNHATRPNQPYHLGDDLLGIRHIDEDRPLGCDVERPA